jgi:phosphoglycerate dehydrogenase-like enzyme
MKILFQPAIVAQALTDRQRQRIEEAWPGAVLVEPDPKDKAAVLAEAADAEVFLGTMSREQFLAAKRLRWFQAVSSGVDRYMFPELVESDVILTSEKGIVGTHLAEHAFALLLSLTRSIAPVIREPTARNQLALRRAAWELTGRTMGIVGMGGTGVAVARRAHAFGMRCLAVDVEPVECPPFVEAVWPIERCHELLGASDVVTICAPLTRQSRRMFDSAAFAAMQPHAILVNVTRGEIVDEAALLAALREGRIGGAGLDVTPIEPLPDDHPLWRLPNAVVTPHTAGASPLRADRAIERFCENLQRLREGQPLLGVIDKRKGY